MPRPPKHRMVNAMPGYTYFKPRAVPLHELETSCLTVDEYESIRLADYEGLEQIQAGERMGISRQTFARIIRSARRKIADALVNGKAICIEGGVYQLPAGPPPWASDPGRGGGRRWRGGRGQ